MNFITIDLAIRRTGIATFVDNKLIKNKVFVLSERNPRNGEDNLIKIDISKTDRNNKFDIDFEVGVRFLKIRNILLDILNRLRNNYGINLVVFEGLSFGSKGKALFDLGKLTGIVQLSILENGFDIDIVPPTVIKKMIVGKGNAPKSLIAMKVFKKTKLDLSIYGEEAEDMYDAIAIGLAYIKLKG